MSSSKTSGLLTPGQKRWIQGRYQGEIAFMDQELGRFVAAVDALPERPGWYSTRTTARTWTTVASSTTTACTMSWSPRCLIRPPKGESVSNARIDRPVSLVDIPPTVLALMGVPEGGWPTFDGVDLSPLWSGEAGDGLEKRLVSVRSNWVT